MKKSKAFVSSFFKVLTAAALLSSCAKTDYDGRIKLRGLNNPTPLATPQGGGATPGGATPGGATPGGRGDSVTPVGNLPVISFTENVVLMSSKLIANLELQLSEASKQKVVAVIQLVDVDAKYGRDFSGFMTPSPNHETTQVITFSPGETRKPLPPIGGRVRYANRSNSCNSDFIARIEALKLQGARVHEPEATITVPCVASNKPKPPPAVTPAPTPEPIPGPVTPPPPIILPEAYFEKPVIVVEPNSDVAVARIKLNRPSDLNVLFDVAAKSDSGKGFEPISEKVMISPKSMSRDFTVKVKREDICKLDRPAGSVEVAEFVIVVTDIVNATMTNRTVRVIVKDDSSRCPQKPIPPPAPVLPNASFEQPRLNVGVDTAQIPSKIVLDKPSLEDVIIDIETQDGTAKQNVDYVPIKLKLVIPKGQASIIVPVTLLRQDKCAKDAPPNAGKGGEFQLVVTQISGAEMAQRSQTIIVPEDKRECPKPVEIKARFENLDLRNEANSEDVVAKIILSEPSVLPVVISIETQDGSATKDKDYVRLNAKQTIPPQKTEIEIPLKLLLDKNCVSQNLAANLNLPKQFNLIVTKIENATMEENTAAISINNEKPVCQPEPPPVSQPAPPPAPKPVAPAPKPPPVTSPAPSPRPAPKPQVPSPAPAPRPAAPKKP